MKNSKKTKKDSQQDDDRVTLAAVRLDKSTVKNIRGLLFCLSVVFVPVLLVGILQYLACVYGIKKMSPEKCLRSLAGGLIDGTKSNK